MAKIPESNGALNGILRVAAEMLREHNRQVEAAKNSDVIATPAIDCEALLTVIQAAQQVYTENCPGP